VANASDVINGKMTLEGEWTQSMIDNLNVIQKEWGNSKYGTYVDEDFTASDIPVQFSAVGRGDYSNNLQQIGIWIAKSDDEKVRNAYDKLCAELSEKVSIANLPTAWISISFKENESSSQILQECKGEINYYNGNLTGFVTETEEFDYTPKNLVEMGFYDDINDVDMGVLLK
jgi:hypothetical protein